jgi:hypothetical protein
MTNITEAKVKTPADKVQDTKNTDLVLILSTGDFEDGDIYTALRWDKEWQNASPEMVKRTLDVMVQEINKKLNEK